LAPFGVIKAEKNSVHRDYCFNTLAAPIKGGTIKTEKDSVHRDYCFNTLAAPIKGGTIKTEENSACKESIDSEAYVNPSHLRGTK